MSAEIDPVDRGVVEEQIRFPGDGRELEGRIAYADAGVPAFSALIAGPHPLLGGDMENNMVRALLLGIAARGGLSLAFQYAGVGSSEGGPRDWTEAATTFWNEGRINEESKWVRDTSAAWSALRQLSGTCNSAAIGYSFGCWAVSQDLPGSGAGAAVFISPNPVRHRFAGPNCADVPILVIHSENDFACCREDVERWCSGLHTPPRLLVVPSAEHFFRGRETAVVETVLEFLESHLTEDEPCPQTR